MTINNLGSWASILSFIFAIVSYVFSRKSYLNYKKVYQMQKFTKIINDMKNLQKDLSNYKGDKISKNISKLIYKYKEIRSELDDVINELPVNEDILNKEISSVRDRIDVCVSENKSILQYEEELEIKEGREKFIRIDEKVRDIIKLLKEKSQFYTL